MPVIRDDHGALAAPFPVTFLTSPAPNAGELARRSTRVDVRTILSERAERVIAVAAHHGVRTLVLGAWGCGVFRNDPAHVADAFAAALRTWGPAFDRGGADSFASLIDVIAKSARPGHDPAPTGARAHRAGHAVVSDPPLWGSGT